MKFFEANCKKRHRYKIKLRAKVVLVHMAKPLRKLHTYILIYYLQYGHSKLQVPTLNVTAIHDQ
jgi:hypothetical protein